MTWAQRLRRVFDIDEASAKHAIEMFSRAVELDPGLARAHAWLACSTARSWDEITDERLDACLATVPRARELDPDEAEAHRIIGAVNRYKMRWDEAEFHIQRSLELNPNDAHIAVKAGEYMSYAGRSDEAVALITRAMRLNPLHPAWYWQSLGLAHYVAGRFEEAIGCLLRRNVERGVFDLAYLVV